MTRPLPSQADRQAAEAFVRDVYDNDPAISRAWLAQHRDNLVRMAAVAEMQRRQDAEIRKHASQWDQFFHSLERKVA